MAIIYANVLRCEECPLNSSAGMCEGYTVFCTFADNRVVGFVPRGSSSLPPVPDWCPLRADVPPEIYGALKDTDIVGFNCM